VKPIVKTLGEFIEDALRGELGMAMVVDVGHPSRPSRDVSARSTIERPL
jgi:hypothetical protein